MLLYLTQKQVLFSSFVSLSMERVLFSIAVFVSLSSGCFSPDTLIPRQGERESRRRAVNGAAMCDDCLDAYEEIASSVFISE